MRVTDLCDTSSPRSTKGRRQDERTHQSLKQRENARRNNQDAQNFADVMASIYPEHFGDSK